MEELRDLLSRDANRRMSQCSGKFKYESFKAAEKGLRRPGLQVYHCKVCQTFHVGTIDRGRKLAKREKRERLRHSRDEEITA